MTIDKKAWLNAEKVARPGTILPSSNKPDVPQSLVEGKGIGLIVKDGLVDIRNTPIHKYIDHNGSLTTVTCADIFQSIFREAIDRLCNTDASIYVFCVDKIEMPLKAKMATAKKRAKQRESAEARGEPARLELAPGETTYFSPNKPFPPSMSLVFKTPEAKREFYMCMVDYVTSVEFQNLIPKEKIFIFSGGFYSNDRLQSLFKTPRPPGQLPPIAVGCDRIVAMEEEEFPELVEGDLDAWRWVLVFPELDFFVISGDGDLLAVGLLNMHRIIKENSTRRGWFLTPRRVGSEPIAPSVAAFKKKQQEIRDSAIEAGCSSDQVYMMSGGVPASTTTTKAKWIYRYVNMPAYHRDIKAEAIRLHVHDGVSISNPVALFVLALLLSSKSNDFICCEEFVRGVGGNLVFETYLQHIDKLDKLIRTGTPAGDDPNSKMPGFRYTIVNVKALRLFAELCYEKKASSTIRKQFRSEEDRNEACKRKAEEMMKQYHDDPRKMVSIAGNIAWTFQYMTHGIDQTIPMTDALLKTSEGASIYGFDEQGWTLDVKMANNVICPPLYTK